MKAHERRLRRDVRRARDSRSTSTFVMAHDLAHALDDAAADRKLKRLLRQTIGAAQIAQGNGLDGSVKTLLGLALQALKPKRGRK